MHRACLMIAALAAFSAGERRAGASESLSWDYEGYRSILDAAALAKGGNQLILVGLSGGDG